MNLQPSTSMTDLEAFEADCRAEPELREVFLAMPGPPSTLSLSKGEMIPYAREQARQIGLPVERWRHHVARLIALGLATYGPLIDPDDGRPKGSSYWLTDRGTDLRRVMECVR